MVIDISTGDGHCLALTQSKHMCEVNTHTCTYIVHHTTCTCTHNESLGWKELCVRGACRYMTLYIMLGPIHSSNLCHYLISGGEVYAWGTNSMGQCGQGHSNGSIVTPSKVQGLEGVQVQQISAGTSHSMVWTAVPLNRWVPRGVNGSISLHTLYTNVDSLTSIYMYLTQLCVQAICVSSCLLY